MRSFPILPLLVTAGFLLGGSACSDESTGALPELDGAAHDAPFCTENDRRAGKCPTLAAYALFMGSGVTQDPAPGVFAYDVIAPLFADEAAKHRFIQLPSSGAKARYSDRDPWELPVG